MQLTNLILPLTALLSSVSTTSAQLNPVESTVTLNMFAGDAPGGCAAARKAALTLSDRRCTDLRGVNSFNSFTFSNVRLFDPPNCRAVFYLDSRCTQLTDVIDINGVECFDGVRTALGARPFANIFCS
ncbi:hypothetical protein QBC34DRAFT_431351 [Podospora aff. communis PSN243]|uniref:Cyanovirin-N domain-containing protein n=1 Tax=Podospora aff. communis PSN243 TaxID=3040156 RepID=A0AAV9G414_9PEZI|nr:hypothetical protein QBC34DRAFT_431351 [Podospora aff. communis PSN243]